jgi:D-alanine--D-alanine ligase
MKIAIACNRKSDCNNYLKAEYDSDRTVEAVSEALRDLGHTVSVVEADESALQLLSSGDGGVDLVFNIAEGIPGECRESQIPAFLDMMGIPYTGPGVRATAISLNKHLTKTILRVNGIPTAPWVLYPDGTDAIPSLRFPVVLKPVHEGSSIGVTGAGSFAANHAEAIDKASKMREQFSQAVLVEEFLSGAEITAGIFGNRELEVLPLLEIYTEMYPPECLNMATKNAKTVYESDSFSGSPRTLDSRQQERIAELARMTYRAIGCRDYGRVDFRLSAGGEPCVMEVNPIPGINPKVEEVSYFTKICRMAGMSYRDMIGRILDKTMERLQFG